MSKTTTINNSQNATAEQELADDLELVNLLRENPDIFIRHPELLVQMQVPHASGAATSLIERQVDVLRQKIREQDGRLCELMDVARDNGRLSEALHKLSVSLFTATDMDDVISIVLDMLRNHLGADYAVIRLLSSGDAEAHPDARYIDALEAEQKHFKTVFEQRSVICGKPSEEQKQLLFADDAEHIKSAAVIPLAAGSAIGLVGLGSKKSSRFTASMAVDFLGQVGELVSAAIARHR